MIFLWLRTFSSSCLELQGERIEAETLKGKTVIFVDQKQSKPELSNNHEDRAERMDSRNTQEAKPANSVIRYSQDEREG